MQAVQLKPEKIVTVENAVPMTTTRIIAESFGKTHHNVVKKLENVECSDYFRDVNFNASSYVSLQGKTLPEYKVTKDGFIFLVMGFTGKKAAMFKEQFIAAFNLMEARLRKQQANPLDGLSPTVKALVELDLRVSSLEEKPTKSVPTLISTITKDDVAGEQYFSLKEYAIHTGIRLFGTKAGKLGQQATGLCMQRGIKVGLSPHAKYHKVHTYPESILKIVLEDNGFLLKSDES